MSEILFAHRVVFIDIFIYLIRIDITYIPTLEGWLYLAGVMDSFSKRFVGYAIADNMKTDLVIQALRSAVSQRKQPRGLIHHSVKGSQYTSYFFQAEHKRQTMQARFAGTGACLDNAIIHTLEAQECSFQNRVNRFWNEQRL